jgi:CheY-like chemotaxis protein
VIQALQWAIRSTANELRLRARLVESFDPVPHVIGDEARLGQVFVNLLVNAAQAIPPGRYDANAIHLSVALDPRGRVAIEVRDTGAGIPDDVRARIFEPFFTTKAIGVGTGLGLSISHGIVTSIGGEMEVDSVVGKGTSIRVILRAAPSEPASPPSETPAPQTTIRGRILAIDDERMMLRAMQRMLRGHDVVCTESAIEALAMIDGGEHFDVIISDLTMPSMTGIEFFEELLKRSPEMAHGVVFITGAAITTRTEDFLQSISNQWIEKPFEAATLQSVVNRRLTKA